VALVISAPSGTGKSTLVRRLLDEFPHFSFSVSYTTRTPRPGEVDGREYHFVDEPRFLELVEEGFFAEWAKVYSNYYGTPLGATLESLKQGTDLLFDIDVQGARQLRSNLAFGEYIFIWPPSRQALEERLRKRGSDDRKAVEERLEQAAGELQAAKDFDYWVLNDELEAAYARLRCIYLAACSRAVRSRDLSRRILDGWDRQAGAPS
jgi:guanylate kinase